MSNTKKSLPKKGLKKGARVAATVAAMALAVGLWASAPKQMELRPTLSAPEQKSAPPSEAQAAQPPKRKRFKGIAPAPKEEHRKWAKELALQIDQENRIGEQALSKLTKALERARWASQGEIPASQHPMSEQECRAEIKDQGLLKGGLIDAAECGHANMAKVPGRDGVCVDRYEFPNVPCAYPVTWVNSQQAQSICEAQGKRLCDASEWEAACSGEPEPLEWEAPGNKKRERVWAYGERRLPQLCAMGSGKSEGCEQAIEAGEGGERKACGANTWPAGARFECAGELGVYDLHGNAAEIMNLPRDQSERGVHGGSGVTELKGSWFAFSAVEGKRTPHPDDCRWRAPGWHRTETRSASGHMNYHLGFRCCADAPR